MTTRRLGIVMHGVTGRMGMNQHLIRSIAAIRRDGGVALADGSRVMPDPILVGRNAAKIQALAQANGIERFTTDLDAAQDAVFSTIERGVLRIAALDEKAVPRIRELMEKYADHPMDLADATLVRVAERERLSVVFTLDRTDFGVYRMSRNRPFKLIP